MSKAWNVYELEEVYMATLFLPFGYPGYPQKQLAEHIAKSEKWLQ